MLHRAISPALSRDLRCPAGAAAGARAHFAGPDLGPLGIVSVLSSPSPPLSLPSGGFRMPIDARLHPGRRALLALVVLVFALPVVAHAGWPPDPLQNVPLCTTAFSSQIGSVVTDQKGGAIAVW